MLSWPFAPKGLADKGLGKLPSASMKGGISSVADPAPLLEFGLMERMPTMMIGTMRPSELLSPASLESLGPVLRGGVGFPEAPNLNIRKKFNGPSRDASLSPSAPCLKAEAMRPFCKALRKPSKLPSSPPEPTSPIVEPVRLLASPRAWWSSPINVAAVAAAATDNSLLNMAAWSSFPLRLMLRSGDLLRRSEEVRCLNGRSGRNALSREFERRFEYEERG